MLFTSLAAVLAVSAGTTPAPQPQWQPDYSTAARLAAAQQKPLAVFVGHGQAGFPKLATDGGPAAEAAKALGEKFVSVYVDADTPAGKPLAAALQVTDGLVISDRTGSVQALRHQGPVSPATLNSYLTTYSADRPVVQTVQVGGLVADTVPPAAPAAPAVAAPAPYFAPVMGGCAGGNCGTPVMTGGCAGGRCGGGMMGGFGNFLGGFGGGCAGGSCGGGRMGLFR